MKLITLAWDWLCNPPRWEAYKSFYQITIFRYLTVWFSIVPIAAGILYGLPDPLPLSINGITYEIELSLPFNWQILWLSSFLFLISFVVYLKYCPSFIKQYNRFSDYLSYGHDRRWISWLAKSLIDEGADSKKFLTRLKTKGYLTEHENDFIMPLEKIKVDPLQTIAYMEFEGKIYSLGMPRLGDSEADKDAERAIFWEIFGRYSSSKIWARNLIRLFIYLSLLAFIFVLFQHVASGFMYLCQFLLNTFE
ncbi:hypothetical protein [Stutzerimonas stutzeri]|uniref:hypothetical protein n=1 Tax=Stutzerimonas stutzeri TaxID=316 RepID=UPI00210C8FBC|nr:hypothetical protein [Stutzerimonas stutzeri]MCQ4256493.1 hypothetical protein [Stutzerimonas stutzeri]